MEECYHCRRVHRQGPMPQEEPAHNTMLLWKPSECLINHISLVILLQLCEENLTYADAVLYATNLRLRRTCRLLLAPTFFSPVYRIESTSSDFTYCTG